MRKPTIDEFVAIFPFLRTNPELAKELLNRGIFQSVPAGTNLYWEGDNCGQIVFVTGGEIRVYMKKNVGSIDRAIRIIAGLTILSLAFVGPATPWAYLGLVPLLTGIFGWCPPYALLGLSTCRKSDSCGHLSGKCCGSN